jgi:hypothetical protein
MDQTFGMRSVKQSITRLGNHSSLQRHNTENSKQIVFEEELRDLSPNFHIHVFVSDLYIPTIGLTILLQGKYVDRSWEYINRFHRHMKCGN